MLGLATTASVSAMSNTKTKESQTADKRIELTKGLKYSLPDNITPEEKEYMDFLYAYMPLPDIADHDSDYFLKNIRVALKARAEMPWGKEIPEKEFKYFVVPVRVNDEPLDQHREVFYDELKDRIKNLEIKQAILEVNHWCHEKATYQPSDGRTHSPLQTVYTAIGRCGEESTFTVAALRSVGIPARQVYTPRWAHTDDNHAWVEAYADGKWHFLGACEPEAVLDLGWFNAPASRGMLMNTRVLGQYAGSEEVLIAKDDYTDINVTQNYADTDKINVYVMDSDGKPVDASVDFCVYNYAEFYPLATRRFSKSSGKPVSLQSGKGDLLIWASDGKNIGFKKVSVGKDQTVYITLGRDGFFSSDLVDLNITPPKGENNIPSVPVEMARENDRRKMYEDSLRNGYAFDSFVTEDIIAIQSDKLGVDKSRLAKVLKDGKANYKVLLDFLSGVDAKDRSKALTLLEVISDKDRSDVRLEVLADHISADGDDNPLFDLYILNPRVDNEQLTPFRSIFKERFSTEEATAFKNNPESWDKWVIDNISLVDGWYPAKVRMSPEAVLATGKSDRRSREIMYVCGARSFGIPARIDPISGKPQRVDSFGEWTDADINRMDGEALSSSSCKGYLKLDYDGKSHVDNPMYYAHFTLSKITDGRMQLLGYDDFAPWKETFQSPQPLDCGEYILVTGQRLADGGVLARIKHFVIQEGKQTDVMMEIRQDETAVQVLGNLDAETRYMSSEGVEKSILSTTGRGFYVLGIVSPLQEPSIHSFNDIAAVADELEKAGRPILLLASDSAQLNDLEKAVKSMNMPANLSLGYDMDRRIINQLADGLNLSSNSLPVFVIADTFNRVVYVIQGYNVGLGKSLLNILHKIE